MFGDISYTNLILDDLHRSFVIQNCYVQVKDLNTYITANNINYLFKRAQFSSTTTPLRSSSKYILDLLFNIPINSFIVACSYDKQTKVIANDAAPIVALIQFIFNQRKISTLDAELSFDDLSDEHKNKLLNTTINFRQVEPSSDATETIYNKALKTLFKVSFTEEC